ncbi:MAG TPA: hypothetical protein PLN21_14795 [Gemmatales bacterium]|nr:hypothetical protein [Gemmatales bacterium]
MTWFRGIAFSLVAWVAVGVFWFALTRGYHPSLALAVIVTTSLVMAYAAAAYINQLVLIPQCWASRQWRRYWWWLLTTMVALTLVALAVIRVSYNALWGPDTDPYGVIKHFAIDFFGMSVHLGGAGMVVWFVQKVVAPARVR